ncbi:MAG: hypothetical protein KatS3mg088_173 [Patescibacteria group bacterium]|nr:MAG: hypothetical protein KatS3mg088_173 [Patescibacteria group bacterium]
MANEKKLSRRILKIKAWLLKTRRKILSNIVLKRVLFASFLFLLVFSLFFVIFRLIKNSGALYYARLIKTFVVSSPSDFRSDNLKRVNFLVLGKGGAGHEAPDLTDTIMFVSLSLEKPRLVLISLPRDIWIPSLRAKLNSVYYWGNQKEMGGGLVLAKEVVSEIVGQPVHYSFVVDFSVFKEVIDILGGVDVYVENAFVDNWYPIAGKEKDNCNNDPLFKCRYETVRFEKGWQKMNGETALKFVRSRKAEGDEGTDFARAKRQQKIMAAIKDALLKKDFWMSPEKIKRLWQVVFKYVETDIDNKAIFALLRRFVAAGNNINSFVLDENLLTNPPISSKYDNLYVFIPKSGNWDQVHSWVQGILLN